MTKSSIGQLPDKTLAVSHSALAIVLVQLVHHNTQAVDEASRGNLKMAPKLFNIESFEEETKCVGGFVSILKSFIRCLEPKDKYTYVAIFL